MGAMVLAMVCGIAAVAPLVHGQEFRATLTGRVLDSAGAAVPKARIRVTNAATGLPAESVATPRMTPVVACACA